MRQVTVITAVYDSANARYHEVPPAKPRIVMALKKNRNKSADAFVKLCEFFDQGRKVDVSTHLAEL